MIEIVLNNAILANFLIPGSLIPFNVLLIVSLTVTPFIPVRILSPDNDEITPAKPACKEILYIPFSPHFFASLIYSCANFSFPSLLALIALMVKS